MAGRDEHRRTARAGAALATWADTLAGLIALDEIASRVPVTLQLDVSGRTSGNDPSRVQAV